MVFIMSFSSNLTSLTYIVYICATLIHARVPQGSVMGPIERHSIIRHSYDDETQIPNSATLCQLTDMRLYIDDRTGWVTDNKVTLKDDKTDVELLPPVECPLPFLFPTMLL